MVTLIVAIYSGITSVYVGYMLKIKITDFFLTPSLLYISSVYRVPMAR